MEQRTAPISLASAAPPRNDVSVAWLLTEILRARRLIGLTFLIGILIGLIPNLKRSPSFTAEFSFLPQAAQDPSRGGGLASLAGQFGISVGAISGDVQPPQLYADVLTTHTILSSLVRDTVTRADGRRVPLAVFMGTKEADSAVTEEQTVRTLRENVITTAVAARTTGVVTVRVTTSSARASYEITERLLDALNRFNQVTRQSQASAERRFAEARLAETRAALTQSEDSLQRFLQGNRQFIPASQLQFQQARLESAVSLQRDVVHGLAQEVEQARLREVRDTPVITMVERPTIPALRDPMGRVRSMFMWAAGSIMLAIMFVIGRAGWRMQREREPRDPAYDSLDLELAKLRHKAR